MKAQTSEATTSQSSHLENIHVYLWQKVDYKNHSAFIRVLHCTEVNGSKYVYYDRAEVVIKHTKLKQDTHRMPQVRAGAAVLDLIL